MWMQISIQPDFRLSDNGRYHVEEDRMAGFRARPFCAAHLIALPLAGSAQEAASSGDPEDSTELDELENLVITARRRPEFLQETPVATTVLGGELLEQRGVDSL